MIGEILIGLFAVFWLLIIFAYLAHVIEQKMYEHEQEIKESREAKDRGNKFYGH
jgi:hypothetical protein